MITSKNFDEYVTFLKENFNDVIEYRERTGTFEPNLIQIGDDLFNEDPFVAFGATVAASIVLHDKALYH